MQCLTAASLTILMRKLCWHRCFTFGIGQNACRRMVRELAAVSRGTAEFLAEGERLQPRVGPVLFPIITVPMSHESITHLNDAELTTGTSTILSSLSPLNIFGHPIHFILRALIISHPDCSGCIGRCFISHL